MKITDNCECLLQWSNSPHPKKKKIIEVWQLSHYAQPAWYFFLFIIQIKWHHEGAIQWLKPECEMSGWSTAVLCHILMLFWSATWKLLRQEDTFYLLPSGPSLQRTPTWCYPFSARILDWPLRLLLMSMGWDLSQCHFIHHKSRMDWNGPPWWRLAIYHLGHCTAFRKHYFSGCLSKKFEWLLSSAQIKCLLICVNLQNTSIMYNTMKCSTLCLYKYTLCIVNNSNKRSVPSIEYLMTILTLTGISFYFLSHTLTRMESKFMSY
jgi:hypothetical protein